MKPSRHSIEFEIGRIRRQKADAIYYHGETPDRIKPTPETARKRKKDVVIEMEDRGHLMKDQVEAACEIREIFQMFETGMFAGSSYDFSGTGGGRRASRQPIERLTDRQAAIYKHCYTPWMTSVSKRMVRPGYRLSAMCWEIIIDNVGTSQVAKARGMAKETVRDHLTDALDEYVHLSQSMRRPG
jgi:hypothetical protein